MTIRKKEYGPMKPVYQASNTDSSAVRIRPNDTPNFNQSSRESPLFSPARPQDRLNPSYSKKRKATIAVHSDDLDLFESNSLAKHGRYMEMESPSMRKKLFDLIDMKKLEKSTPSPEKTRKSDLTDAGKFKVEGLIEISDDDEEEDDYDISKGGCRASRLSSFVKKVDPKNLLHSMEQNRKAKYSDVLRKYRKLKIPKPIKYKSALLRKADSHMKVIKKLLDGKQEPCIYYGLAKAQCSKSKHETMSQLDKWQIEWEKFHGGYYGFQRQSMIGSHILEKYENKLLNFSNGNKTVSYWGVAQFSTYVLANEIIIRMIMDDMNMDFEKAQEFCQKTTDYGNVVADSTEVVTGSEPNTENDSDLDDSDVILAPKRRKKI
ncbi:Restriction of telomere capping protein 4 [Candida viswanathii]|uniref:Restriction of telomere capping protein 4 n=1 Tax=Candida viswanathii TaxID=5486 RepID=A0A367YH88_9ASCO|nr:Restriction of telomere capping protein 4 [Candida viswanathii]